jgi:hypothetical protein
MNPNQASRNSLFAVEAVVTVLRTLGFERRTQAVYQFEDRPAETN